MKRFLVLLALVVVALVLRSFLQGQRASREGLSIKEQLALERVREDSLRAVAKANGRRRADSANKAYSDYMSSLGPRTTAHDSLRDTVRKLRRADSVYVREPDRFDR